MLAMLAMLTMLTILTILTIKKKRDTQAGFSCVGSNESQGVKRRLAIMAAQYVNIVFDMLIYS